MKFTDDMICRDGLPQDVFNLLHDLCYHHEGRDVSEYVRRAQAALTNNWERRQDGDLGNCPMCGTPLSSELVWSDHFNDDVCEHCKEMHDE